MNLSDDRFLRDAADQLRAMLPPCSPSDLRQSEVLYNTLGYRVLYALEGTSCRFHIHNMQNAVNDLTPPNTLLANGYVFPTGRVPYKLEVQGRSPSFRHFSGFMFALCCAWRDSMRRLAQHYHEARGLLTQDERATDDDPI